METTKVIAPVGVSHAAMAATAALVGAGIGFFSATPENAVWPHPWHHDDFNLLGLAGVHVEFGTVRPLAAEISALLAALGPAAVYLALSLLVALPLALAVLWAAIVLDVRRGRAAFAAVGFAVGAVFFLFEASPWTVRYMGHLTNALSASLGMAAGLLALQIRRLGTGGRITMVALYGLAGLAKEDLLLLPMLSLAPAFVESWRIGDRRGARVCARYLIAFVTLGAAIVAYNVRSGSPFLFGSGTYEARLDPTSILATVKNYLVCTRYARNLLVGLATASLASIGLRLATPARWSLLWLAVLALIAPYAPIGAHFYPLYAFNWLPLMLAALAWTIVQAGDRFPSPSGRVAVVSLAAIAVVSLYGIARKERRAQAVSISSAQTFSRQAMASAAAAVQAHPDARYAVVLGADEQVVGPWFASTGVYLNRALGREVRWLVLQRPGSFARKVIDEQRWPHDWGRIDFVDESCWPALAGLGLPVVSLDAAMAVGEAPCLAPDATAPPRRSAAECGVARATDAGDPGREAAAS
jgi:hypothetical protein